MTLPSPPDRSLPPPMERQMARGSRLRRLEERVGRLRYRSAASAGGVLGLTIALASLLDNWLPALQPSRPITARWAVFSIVFYIVWGILLALIVVGLLRGWTRWRVGRMRNSLRVALCALLLPYATEAQQLDSLRLGILAREVGAEVRVSTPSTERIHGRLLEVTADTLRIQQATGPRAVPFSSRDTLWVKEPLGWTAAGYGALVGLAGAGGILLLFRTICGSGDDPCTGFGHAAWVLGRGAAVLGAGAGLVVGEFMDHWVRKTP